MNLSAIIFSFIIIGILFASLVAYILFRFFRNSSFGNFIDSLSLKMRRFISGWQKKPAGYLFDVYLIVPASFLVLFYVYILISGFYTESFAYGLIIPALWNLFVFTGLIFAYTSGTITADFASSFILKINKFISGLYSRKTDEKK